MRWLARGLAVLALLAAALWWLGPYEPAELAAEFDAGEMDRGVQAYFDAAEARFDDITPGVQKRVIWASAAEQRTPIALVYLHGFSATSEEVRPLPDRIAAALGANLVFTRLTGHGRSGPAMAEATVGRWMTDAAEALAAARAVGERVVVIGTSTGGTLAVAAALDPEMSRDVAAMILIAPNFAVNNPMAGLLTWPGARYWLPWVMGAERAFEPRSEAQARYWTTLYPVVAVLPMAALVRAVRALDLSQIAIPALFWFSPDDRVVRAEATERVAARWGGPVTLRRVTMRPGDDRNAHVVAGDALSPGQTDLAAAEMTAWLRQVLGL